MTIRELVPLAFGSWWNLTSVWRVEVSEYSPLSKM